MAMTQPGMAFLQDAFAPPDFQQLEVYGVPDKFVGKTICKQHMYSGTVTMDSEAGIDTIVIVPPVPGYAYFAAQIPQGEAADEATFEGVSFFDAPVDFGTTVGSTSINYSKFRVVALSCEINIVSNPLTTSGSIAVARTPMSLDPQATSLGTAMTYLVTGNKGIDATLAQAQYIKPSHIGAYAVAIHDQPDWEFKPILTGLGQIRSVDDSDADFLMTSNGAQGISGIGDHDTLVFRLSGQEPSTKFAIQVWMTVEYQVQPNSALVAFAHASPGEDPMAMHHYRCMAQAIPPAVPSRENAGFWNMLSGVVSGVGSFLGKVLPGPFGAIASGVGAAAGLIHGATS